MEIKDFTKYQQESRKTWNVIPMDHSISQCHLVSV
jgi:hypothetical protein